jgi:hypothetical protein
LTVKGVVYVHCRNAGRKLYRPDSILIGGHFGSDSETMFESVIVRLRDAASWVNREAITIEVDSESDGVNRRGLVCRLDAPEESKARFSRGEIKLSFHGSREDVVSQCFLGCRRIA